MVICCCFDKGRGRSWAMNAVCRRLCAYQLAADLRPRWRHVDSEYCAADGDSRGQPALGSSPEALGPHDPTRGGVDNQVSEQTTETALEGKDRHRGRLKLEASLDEARPVVTRSTPAWGRRADAVVLELFAGA